MSKIYPNSIILFILLLCGIGISVAGDEQIAEYYIKGNQAYRDKDFSTAIENYMEAINRGGVSAELFYNLGNAYFRAGSLAKAILWYERAKVLAPTDNDINHNLKFVKQLTQDKIESLYRGMLIAKIMLFIESISFRTFWWILVIISSLATLCTVYFILQLRGRWLAVVFWIIFVITLCGWFVKGNRIWERNLAIVMLPRIEVRSEPSTDAEHIFTLHQGTRVGIKENRQDWYRIILEDGNSGWVPENAVEKVITPKLGEHL